MLLFYQKIKYKCKKPSCSSAPIASLFQCYSKTHLKYNELINVASWNRDFKKKYERKCENWVAHFAIMSQGDKYGATSNFGLVMLLRTSTTQPSMFLLISIYFACLFARW